MILPLAWQLTVVKEWINFTAENKSIQITAQTLSNFYGNSFHNIRHTCTFVYLITSQDTFPAHVRKYYSLVFVVLMDKSSNSPTVRLLNVNGYEGRANDVVFCGSEGQQHVVFFPGDVQVRPTKFLFNNSEIIDWKRTKNL